MSKLSRRDWAALAQAVAITERHPERRVELAELIEELGWTEAAKIAAVDCQSRALRLPPWEQPPCSEAAQDDPRARHLLARLRERGLSVYEPDPLAALERAASKPAA
jgi:hypothetical protein